MSATFKNYSNQLKLAFCTLVLAFILTISSIVSVYADTPSTIRFVDDTTGDYAFTENIFVCINDSNSIQDDPNGPSYINLLDQNGYYEIQATPGTQQISIFKNMGAFDPETVCQTADSAPNVVHTHTFTTVAGENYIYTMSGLVTATPAPDIEFTNVGTLPLQDGQIAVFSESYAGFSPSYPDEICINNVLVSSSNFVANIVVDDYPESGDSTTGYATVFDVSSASAGSSTFTVSYPYNYLAGPNCSLIDFYPNYGTQFTISSGTAPVSQPMVAPLGLAERDESDVNPPFTVFSGYSFSISNQVPPQVNQPQPTTPTPTQPTTTPISAQPTTQTSPQQPVLLRTGGTEVYSIIGMTILLITSIGYGARILTKSAKE